MNKEHLHPDGRPYTKEEFVEKIKTDKEFSKRFGNLGPIYGSQWRSWGKDFKQIPNETGDGVYDITTTGIDQIQNLINDLKTNPDSRRLMVTAWNPSDLPKQVLPPCHYGFQVYTRELTMREQESLGHKYGHLNWEEQEKLIMPTRAISLMFNMRSVDTFLGLPFNIASYGLLLTILAKEVNMVPDELIGNLGDVHLYSNHIEQAKEQIGRELTLEERLDLIKDNKDFLVKLGSFSSEYEIMRLCDEFLVSRRTREPFELPTLNQFPTYEGSRPSIESYVVGDFTLKDYQSHPSIKAPLSN
jgi:thymidylate synthase